jgi:hypothetical protein
MPHVDVSRLLAVFALSFVAASACLAQPNERVQLLHQQDGADRIQSRGKPWDPKVSERDAERAAAVREELKAGRLKEAKDFFAAAMVLQHGTGPDDYRLANALSWIAYSMADDPESVPAREAAWLYAASWDRLLLSLDRKQWYGTQSIRNPLTFQPGQLLPMEEGAATPKDKERFSGPRFSY